MTRGDLIAYAMLVASAGACSATPPVRHIGTCAALADPVRVSAMMSSRFSIGVIGDRTLLLWMQDTGTETPDAWIQWLDASFLPDGAPARLGTSYSAAPPRFVVQDGALHAQLWVDPTGPTMGMDAGYVAAIWDFAPGASPSHRGPPLPVTHAPVTPCAVTYCLPSPLALDGAFLNSGPQGRLPIAISASGAVAAVAAIPQECASEYENLNRFLAFDSSRGAFSYFGSAPSCEPLPDDDDVSNVWITETMSGALGAFFRLSSGYDTARHIQFGRLHYARLDGELHGSGPSVIVERERPEYAQDGGYQPRAVPVSGDALLFTLRDGGANNSCQRLRWMRDDASDVHDAPWQLPCIDDPATWMTESNDLVRLPGGDAAIVWAERSTLGDLSFVQRLTASIDWQEHLRLALLTREGQEGSDPIDVGGLNATAVDWTATPRTADNGPFPADFLLSAAADGTTVVIAWLDERSSAPGIYARRFQCVTTSE